MVDNDLGGGRRIMGRDDDIDIGYDNDGQQPGPSGLNAFGGGMIGAFIPASCLTFHRVVPVAYSIRLAAARVSFRAAIPLIFGSLPCVTTNPYSSITSTLIYELTCNQFH